MIWILYATSAFFLWAVANVMGKVIISKIAQHPIVYLALFNIVIGLITLFFIPFKSLYIPSNKILFLIITSAILYISAIIPYFYALKKEEVSRVIPLWQFIPLFTLIFASIFLNEKLTLNYYIAFIFLVIGGLLISVRSFKDLITHNSVFWLMILSSILFAAMDTINKYIFTNAEYWNSFILTRIFCLMIASLFLFLKPIANEFKNVIKTLNMKKISLLISSDILDIAGLMLYSLALTIGPVSLISSLNSIQPLFVLIIATIASIFFHKHLQEEIKKSTLIYKFTAIILMCIGIWLIYK